MNIDLLKRVSATSKKEAFNSRLIGLDVIRAVAIILVLWFHSFPILAPLVNLPYIGKIVNKIRTLSYWVGPLGVDLFFVLSGFLIGTILINSFFKSKDFGFVEIKNFWIRRWFRTIPNYYFMITVAFILYHYLYNIDFNWKYYLFIQNLTSVHPQFFAEAWSLAVEEWFYLTLPIFLLLVNMILKKKQKKDTILKITFTCYLLTFIILRLIKAGTNSSTDFDYFDSEIRKVVLFRLDSVMYGVIVAYLMYFQKDLLYRAKEKLLFIGIAATALLISIFYWGYDRSTIYKTNEIFHFFIDSSYLTLIPLFFSFLIPSAYFLKDIKYPLFKKVILHISLISYSMYLVHYALIYVPFFKGIKSTSAISSILFYLLYWVLVIVISTINYNFFEKPIIKFRELLSSSE